RTGPDLQHLFLPGESDRLQVPGLNVRLGDRLATADGKCRVLVGIVPYARGNEKVARHLRHGMQHGEAPDALLPERLHQAGAVAAKAVARSRTGHSRFQLRTVSMSA